MTYFQRTIKYGIRLYNYKPRGINFVVSPINRLEAPAKSYRSLCSSSCGDGHSNLSNVKRTFNVDTSAMINALKAEGIPRERAEEITNLMADFFAALEKDGKPYGLVRSKFEILKENIVYDLPRRPAYEFWSGFFFAIILILMLKLFEASRRLNRRRAAEAAASKNQ